LSLASLLFPNSHAITPPNNPIAPPITIDGAVVSEFISALTSSILNK